MPENQDWQPDNEDFNSDDQLSDEERRYAPIDDDQGQDDEAQVSPLDSTDSDQEDPSTNPERTFEDLTLMELAGQFFRSPKRTRRSLSTVTRASRRTAQSSTVPIPVQISRPTTPSINDSDTIESSGKSWLSTLLTTKLNTKQIQLILYAIAVATGLIGSSLLLGPGDVRRSEENALVIGAPFLWSAFFIWLGAELYGNWQSLVNWWSHSDLLTRLRWVLRIIPVFVWLTALFLFTDAMTAPAELALGLVQVAIGRVILGLIFWLAIELIVIVIRYMAHNNPEAYPNWVTITPVENEPDSHARPLLIESIRRYITIPRIILLICATLSSILVWMGTPNNQIPPPIILMWFLSAILWSLVFAPTGKSLFDWATGKVDAFRRIDWRANAWAITAFVVILVLGVGFRLVDLDTLPPEMTSDHVEKILDANRVHNGEFNIFFANNGGREPIQMYLMSLFSMLPGQDFNHYSLKLLAALESLLTLPILVWLGVELMGKRDRRFGLVVGLLLAGLVAVSYWHVAITRQALRIVMTPIVASLLLIYLSRAMRYNQRADFIKVALILGFGLYAYQAVRMLPVVVVAGIAIAIVIRSTTWRDRFMYGVNLAILVFISLMVFLPMLHYSSEDPDHFWRRTAGRILGDDVVTEQLADGTIIERQASTEEQVAAFNANVPILMTNVRNALLMFNWKGDVGWISGVPNEPAMDVYSGTFLILGLAGWAVMMLRSRDPVIWLMPVMIFIMLLPSALSIAYPLENPSHTRTSGAIPPAYLIAVFPIAIIAFQLMKAFNRRLGVVLAIVFCSGIILLANARNTNLYFNSYPRIYIESSYPYSEAGSVLRGFAESGGSYGNAFMIAYTHWWGHRAIGIAAGEPWWPNGIVSLDDLPNFMNVAQLRSDQFRLDPDKDLLFFYSPDDEATSLQLKEWFPDGREQEIQSYHFDDIYMLYRVPFLGEAKLQSFIGTLRD